MMDLCGPFQPLEKGGTVLADGTFMLELKDRPPLTGRAGEAMVEPPNVAMTGHNPSASEPTNVVIFYVSTPDTPFLDPLHH